MRRIISRSIALTVAFLIAGAGTAAAQNHFEGVVTMNMDMAGMMNVDVVSYAKAGKVRQEMSMMGQDMVTIIDLDSGTSLTLMPTQQAYMKMDYRALAEQMLQRADSIATPTLTAVGTSDTILGHKCDNYTVTMPEGPTPSGTVQMCVATDLGFYAGALGTSGMSNPAGMDAYYDTVRKTFPNGFFPLRTITSAQGMSMTMVVTKIEPKPLSDDLFKLDIPAGFTEMKLPGGPGTP